MFTSDEIKVLGVCLAVGAWIAFLQIAIFEDWNLIPFEKIEKWINKLRGRT